MDPNSGTSPVERDRDSGFSLLPEWVASLPGPSLGLNQSPGRGLETQPGPQSLSTSTSRYKALLGCIRLPRLLLADALRETSMVHSRDSPCVCSSGPPHSPLLTHPSPLFHQQTLGLKRQSNWLAVPCSQLPSLPKHTALFILHAQPPGPHCHPDPCPISHSSPSLSHSAPARAGEPHGKLVGHPLTTYPSNITSTQRDETTREGREWPEVTAQEDRTCFPSLTGV